MALTQISQFILSLTEQADTVRFEDTMTLIDGLYDFTPIAFNNGDQLNQAGQNSGSCKVFSFGQMHQLTAQQTLVMFGQHYRDVVATPQGNDHHNIRQFMQHGWNGVVLPQLALVAKSQ